MSYRLITKASLVITPIAGEPIGGEVTLRAYTAPKSPAKGQIDTALQDRLFGGDGVISPARRPVVAKNAFDDLCRKLPMQGSFLQGIDAARADHIAPCIQRGQVIGGDGRGLYVPFQGLSVEKVHDLNSANMRLRNYAFARLRYSARAASRMSWCV